MMKILVANGFLILVSIIFTLFIAEIGARIIKTEEVVRPVHGISEANKISWPPYFEKAYITEEYEYQLRTNRFGRRDIDWTDEMLSNPFNIIFIGDSFVFGYGVADQFSLPTLLEQHYESVDMTERQVFNYGMPGQISIPEYKQLFEKALDANIKAETVVVAIFIGNDFQPSVIAKKNGELSDIKEDKRKPTLLRSELFALIKNRVKESPRLSGIVLRVGGLMGIQVYASSASSIYLREQTPEQISHFEGILNKIIDIKHLALHSGRKLGLVIIPNKIQVENKNDLTNSVYDAEKPNRRIMDYCLDNDIACLDLLPPLHAKYENTGEALYYPIDRHFNEYGYKVTSKLIFDFVRNLEN